MARPGLRALALVGLLVPAAGSCVSDVNGGFDPPDDAFQFPAGLLLDPRVSQDALSECVDGICEEGTCVAEVCRPDPARWMFVTNANSDLRFNASALTAVNLEKFHCFRQGKDAPGCDKFSDIPEIAGRGAKVSAAAPCRHLATKPDVIECAEAPFIDTEATVHMGSFPTVVAGWDPIKSDDRARLLIPIRGDPSIAWLEIDGGLGAGDADPHVDIECGQGSDDQDSRKCGDDHRVRHLLDDEDLPRIGSEPINVVISHNEAFAYVTHGSAVDLSLIALKDVDGERIDPLLVNQGLFMLPSNLGIQPGALGLAERPCNVDDAPNASFDCTRPLVYAAMRYQRDIVASTIFALDPDTDLEPGQKCVGPEDFDQAGALNCESQFDFEARFFAGGISPGSFAGPPQLGDMAFSEDGNQLFAVQSNPGGLLRIDTSLDTAGNIRDIPAGVVEVCPRATSLALYRDGRDDYALVSCYRSAAIFVVDLASLQVVANIQPGTGPHHMAVDLARELVYVGNTLEASISVIEMSRESSSRFGEIARIGTQEAFSGG